MTNKELLKKVRSGLKQNQLIKKRQGYVSGFSDRKYAYELNRQLSIIIENIKFLNEKKEFLRDFAESNWIKSYIWNIYGAGIAARENLLRLVDSPEFEASLMNGVSEPLKSTGEYRVLIIDNDDRYGKLIKDIISGEYEKFAIDHVVSEKEAIEKFKSTIYDFAFLDINIQKACIPMIEKLKTINKNCSICLMEDKWWPNRNLKDALKLGVIGCLYKPFYNEELLNITKMISKV